MTYIELIEELEKNDISLDAQVMVGIHYRGADFELFESVKLNDEDNKPCLLVI